MPAFKAFIQNKVNMRFFYLIYIKITSKKNAINILAKSHHMGSIYCLDWIASRILLAGSSNDKLMKLMVVSELFVSINSKKNDEGDDIL